MRRHQPRSIVKAKVGQLGAGADRGGRTPALARRGASQILAASRCGAHRRSANAGDCVVGLIEREPTTKPVQTGRQLPEDITVDCTPAAAAGPTLPIGWLAQGQPDGCSTSTERLLQRARDFERCAHWIVNNAHDGVKRNAPLLNLIAQGFELLFKAELAEAGISDARLRSEFGHDLSKMWDSVQLAAVRHRSTFAGEKAFERALADPRPEVDDPPDRAAHFDFWLRRLSDLHSQAEDYALRYPGPNDGVAAPFMADMLDDLIERLGKRGRAWPLFSRRDRAETKTGCRRYGHICQLRPE